MITPALALLLTLAHPAEARVFSAPIVAENEEDLQSLYTDGVIDEADLEALVELYNNPIDLNAARRLEVYNLPGITLDLARAIVADRRKNGPFVNMADLARVDGVTQDILTQIEPFAEVKPPATQQKRDLRGKVRARVIKSFQPVEPLSATATSATPAQLGYEKWPVGYVSTRVDYQRKWEVGFLGAMTEGLNWRDYDADSGTMYAKWGAPMFEFGKAYVSREQGNASFVIGSYTAGFGLGLAFDDTNRSHPTGFYQDLAVNADENISIPDRLFGGAVRLPNVNLGERARLDTTLFASSWWYDVYQYDLGVPSDPDCTDPADPSCDFSSPSVKLWVDDSWHRSRQVTFANAYREDLLGANTTFHVLDAAHVGLTGYVGHMDTTSLPGDAGQLDLVPTGGGPTHTWFGAVGLDGAWSFATTELLAEVSHSFTGGNAALLKSITDVRVGEIEASLRSYGTNFDNPHARGLANADEYAGMRDRDEQGARLKANLAPLAWLDSRAMVDLWQRMSMDGIWNLETYLQLAADPWKPLKITVFGDFKDRDLAKHGDDMVYGGDEYSEVYGEDYDEYQDWQDEPTLTDEEDPETSFDSYTDYRGHKFYWGLQAQTTVVPRTTLTALYKRSYEQDQYAFPKEDLSGCEYWYWVGHYAWVKARVAATSTTIATLRFRYEDEDAYGDSGARFYEAYLQLDQKLPKKTKVSLRGTLGQDLDDPASDWEDWCSTGGEISKDEVCGTGSSESTDVATVDKTPYGLVWATFEWRF